MNIHHCENIVIDNNKIVTPYFKLDVEHLLKNMFDLIIGKEHVFCVDFEYWINLEENDFVFQLENMQYCIINFTKLVEKISNIEIK